MPKNGIDREKFAEMSTQVEYQAKNIDCFMILSSNHSLENYETKKRESHLDVSSQKLLMLRFMFFAFRNIIWRLRKDNSLLVNKRY